MVFSSFIRFAKFSTKSSSHTTSTIHNHFFQASYPYLNTNYYFHGLQKHSKFAHRTKWWNKAETGSTSNSNSFLTISNGHYGLYYSMYNKESERKEKQNKYERYIKHYLLKQFHEGDRTKFRQCMFRRSHHYRKNYGHYQNYRRTRHLKKFLHLKLILIGFTAKFLISKVIKDSQLNIDNFKTFSSKFISSCLFKNLATTNQFSSPYSSIQSSDNVFSLGISKRSFTTISHTHRDNKPLLQLKELPQKDEKVQEVLTEEVDDFETNFLQTQVKTINDAYDNHKSPEDLNIIYPMYQAVKRNNLTLPSIEDYNVVLRSIIERDLDNNLDLKSIESKLTNLLSIYQDLLQSGIKPNSETYKLVINSLLDSSISCSKIKCTNHIQYNEIRNRTKEFTQLSFELIQTVNNQIDKFSILSKIVVLGAKFPELLNKNLLLIFDECTNNIDTLNLQGCMDVFKLIRFSKRFSLMDEEKTYKIIEQAYQRIRQFDNVNDFEVYQMVLIALIDNNFKNNATELLDNILMDYKESLQFMKRPNKSEVSNLLGAFLKSYTENVNVSKGLELMKKFQSIAYLPELPISSYNFIINKLQSNDDHYNDMWALYNRIALRKDYQSTSTISIIQENDDLCCRDTLIALAIQKGDHERVFQLLKEISLKEHLIGDYQIMRMVCNYLSNGVMFSKSEGEYFNQQYFGLLSQLLESQSKHYQSSTNLNDFISEYAQFLTIPIPSEFISNKLAISSISNYNAQFLMSSQLPFKCLENFDLNEDNLYGLVIIARQVMLYSGNDENILNKIAFFEASLINHFEDSANHYIELTDEVLEFKKQLIEHFKNLMMNITVTNYEITEACKHLNIESKSDETFVRDHNSDLSVLLNINYKKGVAQFLDQLEKGFIFPARNWDIIINENFINENYSIIDQNFLQRLWETNCEEEKKLALLQRLIMYNNFEINNSILNFISDQQIYDTEILSLIFKSLDGNLSGIQNFDFKSAIETNENAKWILSYFNYLKQMNEFEKIKSDEKFITKRSDDIKTLILEAEMETDLSHFQEMIEKVGVEDSTKLEPLLIRHDLKKGVSADSILHKQYSNSSNEMIELISFVKLLDSLQQHKYSFDDRFFVSVKHIANALLTSGNLSEMKKIITNNKINDKELLITTMLQSLIDLSKLPINNLSQPIINRLLTFIKFFKILDIGSSIKIENFLQILTILKLNKSDLIEIIKNKLIGPKNQISDIINFYFLEVSLFNQSDKQRVYNYIMTS
ncbi:RPM2 [Candida pseudojiufengensis]|uniref:RPM2 n=1 Tax=Candida pseudojiufengensis TaxID=497109 RepID=UPI0022240E39|nr:RPM2 [Candida pseudojiufengensis]KAI5961221.1 RPM2 [Candida pseudojiufengensis]